MYAVSVTRSFVAQHVLTVPDPGPEGELHSHRFTVEVTFRGPELGEYGYLVDIDAVANALKETAAAFRDETLNDLPPFEGVNPSVERLAVAVGNRLLEALDPGPATALEVAIDEDDVARVRHERAL